MKDMPPRKSQLHSQSQLSSPDCRKRQGCCPPNHKNNKLFGDDTLLAFDVFRVEDGTSAEYWDIISEIPAKWCALPVSSDL